MAGWKIDTPLHRSGYEDDEGLDQANCVDWQCWLFGGEPNTHLLVQFARQGNDRPAAEKIVERILAGLNA